MYIRNCKHCNIEYKTTRYNKLYCSTECVKNETNKTNILKSHILHPLGTDYVECCICGFRCFNLQTHVYTMHNIKADDYRTTYNASTLSKSTFTKLSDKVKGENNPGYQHGGTMSPWSTRSKYHTPEQISEAKRKAQENWETGEPYLRNTQKEYWIKKGYTEEEAYLAVKERQTTFSLEICIEKYGEIEGKSRWQERQDKWQLALSDKTPEEIDAINRSKISSNGTSKPEKILFESIKEIYTNTEDQFVIPRSTVKTAPRGFAYDIRIGNVLIEFHGDFWHMNPSIFKEDDINRVTGDLASDKWLDDKIKSNYATDNGYKILIIWEQEFKMNKDKAIQRCLDFIKENLCSQIQSNESLQK